MAKRYAAMWCARSVFLTTRAERCMPALATPSAGIQFTTPAGRRPIIAA